MLKSVIIGNNTNFVCNLMLCQKRVKECLNPFELEVYQQGSCCMNIQKKQISHKTLFNYPQPVVFISQLIYEKYPFPIVMK